MAEKDQRNERQPPLATALTAFNFTQETSLCVTLNLLKLKIHSLVTTLRPLVLD